MIIRRTRQQAPQNMIAARLQRIYRRRPLTVTSQLLYFVTYGIIFLTLFLCQSKAKNDMKM